MPIDNPGDLTRGHRFTRKAADGRPKCRVCGLVWKIGKRKPEITCPDQPLDEVFEGWGKRYGE